MNKIVLIGLPLMLGLIGLALWAVAIGSVIHSFRRAGFYVTAPGVTTVKITKPGDYTLWNQSAGIVAGQFKTFPTNNPANMTIAVTSKSDGQQIQMNSAMNETEQINGTHRNSIASFQFDSPGEYIVNVSGFSEQRCFYLHQSNFLIAIEAIFVAGAGGMFFVVAGVVVGIYSMIQLSKNKTPLQT